mgnify:CR=1 FL=1
MKRSKAEEEEIKKAPKFDLKDVEVEEDFEDNLDGTVSWKTVTLQKVLIVLKKLSSQHKKMLVIIKKLFLLWVIKILDLKQ